MDLKFKLLSFDPPARFFHSLQGRKHYSSTRIKINLKFKQDEVWGKNLYRFLLDTGAYVSLAPELLMNRFNIVPKFEGFLHGIVNKGECELRVKVGKVVFKKVDEEKNESK